MIDNNRIRCDPCFVLTSGRRMDEHPAPFLFRGMTDWLIIRSGLTGLIFWYRCRPKMLDLDSADICRYRMDSMVGFKNETNHVCD